MPYNLRFLVSFINFLNVGRSLLLSLIDYYDSARNKLLQSSLLDVLGDEIGFSPFKYVEDVFDLGFDPANAGLFFDETKRIQDGGDDIRIGKSTNQKKMKKLDHNQDQFNPRSIQSKINQSEHKKKLTIKKK